jgi:SET domain-containing protein
MLRLLTLLRPSSIHGTGVFAAESIPRGAIVWQFDPREDLVLADLSLLSDAAHQYLRHFSYFDAGRGGYVLCGDNAKWMNHSDEPNTAPVFESRRYECDVAVRDIPAGDEITCNYQRFDKP